jgi:hypothetical protein
VKGFGAHSAYDQARAECNHQDEQQVAAEVHPYPESRRHDRPKAFGRRQQPHCEHEQK